MDSRLIDEVLGDSEKVLIGLGEEFDDLRSISGDDYLKKRELLERCGLSWMIPKMNDFYKDESKSKVNDVLKGLLHSLEGYDFFIVSTSMNNIVNTFDWKKDRFVAPCGGSVFKQCINGCKESLIKISDEDDASFNAWIDTDDMKVKDFLGVCPVCGQKMAYSNVYLEKYNENSYMDNWEKYKKWLQNTLNKKLVILELGVGMAYPTVVRLPFEKIAFYNNKAFFYRVNKKLYHMSAELASKGVSIMQNSIDWLESMC